MTLPLKLICSKNKLRKNGTSLIFIQYCFTSEERTLLNTGIAIPPNYWNRKQGRVSRDLPLKFGEVEKHEVKLNELLRRAEDIVNYALKGNRSSPVNFLKSNFHLNEVSYKISENKPKIILDVFYNIDLYIECKRSSVKHCTINVISAMKKHLKGFEIFRNQPITFDSFDVTFYEEFVKYLTYDIIQMRKKEDIKGFKNKFNWLNN